MQTSLIERSMCTSMTLSWGFLWKWNQSFFFWGTLCFVVLEKVVITDQYILFSRDEKKKTMWARGFYDRMEDFSWIVQIDLRIPPPLNCLSASFSRYVWVSWPFQGYWRFQRRWVVQRWVCILHRLLMWRWLFSGVRELLDKKLEKLKIVLIWMNAMSESHWCYLFHK